MYSILSWFTSSEEPPKQAPKAKRVTKARVRQPQQQPVSAKTYFDSLEDIPKASQDFTTAVSGLTRLSSADLALDMQKFFLRDSPVNLGAIYYDPQTREVRCLVQYDCQKLEHAKLGFIEERLSSYEALYEEREAYFAKLGDPLQNLIMGALENDLKWEHLVGLDLEIRDLKKQLKQAQAQDKSQASQLRRALVQKQGDYSQAFDKLDDEVRQARVKNKMARPVLSDHLIEIIEAQERVEKMNINTLIAITEDAEIEYVNLPNGKGVMATINDPRFLEELADLLHVELEAAQSPSMH